MDKKSKYLKFVYNAINSIFVKKMLLFERYKLTYIFSVV